MSDIPCVAVVMPARFNKELKMKTATISTVKQTGSMGHRPGDFIQAAEDYILALKESLAYEAYRVQGRTLRMPGLVTSESEMRIASKGVKADEAAAAARAKAIMLGRNFMALPKVAEVIEIMNARPNFPLLESLWPACRAEIERSNSAIVELTKAVEVEEDTRTLTLRYDGKEERIALTKPQAACLVPLAKVSPRRIHLGDWQNVSCKDQPYKQVESLIKHCPMLRKFYRAPGRIKGAGYGLIPPGK
ncbi:MAG: hypothetical protein ACP5I8_11555 [Phycisphaerae bacterium]